MNILVIGSGGREHAIFKALHQSGKHKLWCLPGSDAMALMGERILLKTTEHASILDLVRQQKISLVVVGPEQPLAEGLSDFLRHHGVNVFGPSQAAAQLETSKVFAKNFMLEAQVPTAMFEVVTSVAETMEKAKAFVPPFVFKVDGLAAGKGVMICANMNELKQAAEITFQQRSFGTSGDRALLEAFQSGYEISYLILTNGNEFAALPVSQDHKRLLDNNEGPNTGGMGAVAPVAIDNNLEAQIHEQIVLPVLKELTKQDMLYRGVLYIGLMVTDDGPKVIEFNCRFGDPEAQVLIPLLQNDWADVFHTIAEGRVPELSWKENACASVVMVSPGYPDKPQTGGVMRGDVLANTNNSYFIHAGTKKEANGQWQTAGGRVLNAVGEGTDIKSALTEAYQLATTVSWPGCHYRKDIGQGILGKT